MTKSCENFEIQPINHNFVTGLRGWTWRRYYEIIFSKDLFHDECELRLVVQTSQQTTFYDSRNAMPKIDIETKTDSLRHDLRSYKIKSLKVDLKTAAFLILFFFIQNPSIFFSVRFFKNFMRRTKIHRG